MSQLSRSPQLILVILLALALASLGIRVAELWYNHSWMIVDDPLSRADDGDASLALRNENYPQTFISEIRVDVTSPHHWVRLVWAGPQADRIDHGPIHSSPGRGDGCNCNDLVESNRLNSYCTPKGEFTVKGFNDFLPSSQKCKFATWFHIEREIAFHSHNKIPAYPASSGCIRLSEYAAQLIHNNSIAGQTKVLINGNWIRPPEHTDLRAGNHRGRPK